MKLMLASSLLFLAIFGCGPAAVAPGMTFWFGLKGYQDEMNLLAGRPERWPERQRTAESLKTTHGLTLGVSREFNRFVDLDLRRKEFTLALRGGTLRPERVQEMNNELAIVNREMGRLNEIIKEQVADAILRSQVPVQRIEAIATIGLLHLALDGIATSNTGSTPAALSTKVGQHTVTDLGNHRSSVTLPDRAVYLCLTLIFPDEGAGIKCELPPGKT